MIAAVVLLHALVTPLMAGLVAFVQIVHYPLFAKVGREHFTDYETAHQRRTTVIVAPLMLSEAAAAGAMLILPPRGVPPWMLFASIVSVAAVWVLTFFVAVPLHARLARAFDDRAHRALVAWNWPRTLIWLARAALALAIAHEHLRAPLSPA